MKPRSMTTEFELRQINHYHKLIKLMSRSKMTRKKTDCIKRLRWSMYSTMSDLFENDMFEMIRHRMLLR